MYSNSKFLSLSLRICKWDSGFELSSSGIIMDLRASGDTGEGGTVLNFITVVGRS